MQKQLMTIDTVILTVMEAGTNAKNGFITGVNGILTMKPWITKKPGRATATTKQKVAGTANTC